MQDKYRKMYNKNVFGTSDVSILKFYYASFKIHYNNGNVSSVKEFIETCANSATSTSKMAKILELLPLVPSGYATELKRIANIMTIRQDEVEVLFLKEDLKDEDFENFCIGKNANKITSPKILSKEEKISEIINYIRIHNSKPKMKQLGDRMFGYLLKSKVIGVYAPSERMDAWDKYVGKDIKPTNKNLLSTPDRNRNETGKNFDTLIKNLSEILSFCRELQFDEITKIIQSDLDEAILLSSKRKAFTQDK